MRTPLFAGCLALALAFPTPAQGNPSPQTPPYDRVAIDLDSGFLHNAGARAQVVFSQRLRFDGSSWMQLLFGEAVNLPAGSFVRMTAAADGGVQRHDSRTLVEWSSQSALFNGGDLLVELVAGPNTRGNRVQIAAALTGLAIQIPESLCGADDRVLSSDPRQGRLFVGCTGWMAGANLMLTAGHCVSGSASTIIEFNVPLSTSSGNVVRSNPNDQYPFAVQASLNAGIGSDWGVNLVGRNSNTGLLPTEANGGQWYSLGAVPTSTAGQNIRITGYGSTSSPVDPRWYLVQKTHVDSLTQIAGTYLRYIPDTTGGNSGSPVVHENTGNAVGIHTHAGCTSGGNHGTRIDRSDLQTAIANAGRVPGRFQIYGNGCAGSGSSGGQCSGVNANGGALDGSTTSNEYAYLGTTSAPLSVAGFEVFSASNGGSVTVRAALHLDAGGTPSSNAAAVTTVTIGATAGFYRATFPFPVNVPAGRYYVAIDHTAGTTRIANVASGSTGTGYWRRPAASGTWSRSGVVDRPAFRMICAGGPSGATPAIAGTGNPVINNSYSASVAFARASTAAILLTGVSNSTWAGGALPFDLGAFGAGGCALLTSPDIALPSTTGTDGRASLSFPVPNNQALVGFDLFHQWLIADPGVNNFGFVTSNGLQATFGG